MDKYKDFPEQPRHITPEEGEAMYQHAVKQIKEYNPDEIVAVARSGFSYGGWISQDLKLPVGAYWPDDNKIVFRPESKKLVFVDDNILQGTTYQATKEFMAKHYPTVEWQWAVLFSDWYTPESVRNEIIQGARLPYFAEEPMWGSRKVSKDYGVRHRDE
jgi:hypoxanthine phosphoribosyltransferase